MLLPEDELSTPACSTGFLPLANLALQGSVSPRHAVQPRGCCPPGSLSREAALSCLCACPALDRWGGCHESGLQGDRSPQPGRLRSKQQRGVAAQTGARPEGNLAGP